MVKKILSLFLFAISSLSFSQERYCPSPEELHDCNPSSPFEHKQVFENWLENKIKSRNSFSGAGSRLSEAVITLPVVVHVIHRGEAVGSGTNISDAQIISQIEVLNEDFRRLNADTLNTPEVFLPIATDAGIEFQLALRDPDGLPTSGITRTEGPQNTYSDSSAELLAELSSWPADEYVNIWVAPLSNGLLGFAQFPLSDQNGLSTGELEEDFSNNPVTDGVVIGPQFFGSVNKGNFDLNPDFNLGRTTTHEMGHFLGLRHIWGDLSSCDASDFCDDTPVAFNQNFGCPEEFSCGSDDMVQNYMDFTDDFCMNIFTACQTQRMRAVLEFSPRRRTLPSSPALIPPLVTENDLGVLELIEPGKGTCDESVRPGVRVVNAGNENINSFTLRLTIDEEVIQDITVNGSLNPLEMDTIQFSPVNLPEIRQYEFMVNVVSVNGSADLNSENDSLITLVSASELRFESQFETFDVFPPDWIANNKPNSEVWEIATAPLDAPDNQAVSLAFNSSTGSSIGTTSVLRTPVFQPFFATTFNLTFEYSYASNPGSFPEGLIVAISRDCGKTFRTEDIIFERYDEDLATVSPQSDFYVPQAQEDWQEVSVSLSAFTGTEDGVQIAFVGFNGGGNNIYLDNVNVDFPVQDLAAVSIEEPEYLDCDGGFTPSLTISNTGINTINSYSVTLSINNELNQNLIFESETFEPSSSRVVNFQQLQLQEGIFDFSFAVEILDNEPDQNPSNDTITQRVLVNFETDEFPELYLFNDTLMEEGWNSVSQERSMEWSNIRAGSFEAISIQSFDSGMIGDQVRLISPIFDFSNASTLFLNFEQSYRLRPGFSDMLNIFALPECDTENPIFIASFSGVQLSTEISFDPWFPQTEDDWVTRSIPLPQLRGLEDARIVFEFVNDRGNNIYLDEIAILSDQNTLPGLFSSDFQLYPNPAEDFTTLYFNRETPSDLRILLYDVSGQFIDDASISQVQNQNYRIDLSGFVSGFYFIRIVGNNFDRTSRLFVDIR